MKVWVCDTGSYSDRYNTGVYSDEATARQVSQAQGWNDPEGFELDPPVPAEIPQGLTYFAVRMRSDGSTDGFFRNITPTSYPAIDQCWKYDPKIANSDYRGLDLFTFYCWAKDASHAIKIANERRIIALASR